MSDGNHAILLTAPGSGAIAVIRLSGPRVGEFLSRHFSRQAKPGRCIHGLLRDDGGEVIDDPVVARVSEEVADINLHGGLWIVHRMLTLAGEQGFTIEIDPTGILPIEAVDVTPALAREDALGESAISAAVMTHLPLARTELAVRALLAQPRAWAWWHGLPVDQRLVRAKEMLEDQALHWLLHPPQVALVGAPNVGKSTLANQLFAQERSIVADLPGTTRDWVGELANINDLTVMLVDTPGRRDSGDVIEQAAIRQSDQIIRQADLVVEVWDASLPLLERSQSLDSLTAGLPVIRVANKQDQRVWDAAEVGALPVVATTGQGIDLLRRHIARHFGCDTLDPDRPRCWTEPQRIRLQQWMAAP